MPNLSRYFETPSFKVATKLPSTKQLLSQPFDTSGGMDPELKAQLPTQEQVMTEEEKQKARKERSWFWDVLAGISEMTGAEAVKGFTLGLVKGEGFEGALERAEKGAPWHFVADWFRDADQPYQGVETPFSEIRQAAGGDFGTAGNLLADFVGEVVLDPASLLSLGSSAVPKALKPLAVADQLSGVSRAERASKGLWNAMALKVPLGFLFGAGDARLPFRGLGLNVNTTLGMAMDAVADGARSVPGLGGLIQKFSKVPNLKGEYRQQVMKAQENYAQTIRTWDREVFEGIQKIPRPVQDMILGDPLTQRALTDAAELGLKRLSDEASILNAVDNFDQLRGLQKIERLKAADPRFIEPWNILHDPTKVGTDAWHQALYDIYTKYPDVPLPAGWLREGRLAPRPWTDMHPVNMNEFVAKANEELLARGGTPIEPFSGTEAARLVEDGAAKAVTDVKRMAREATKDDLQKFLARMREGGDLSDPIYKKGFEDYLEIKAAYLNKVAQAEITAGFYSQALENYVPSILTDAAKDLINTTMEKKIHQLTAGDTTIMGYMKQRKFTDMMRTEVNFFMRAVGSKATNYESLQTLAATVAEDVTKYGWADALVHKIFPKRLVDKFRATDPDAVNWFYTNPIYSDMKRFEQAGKALAHDAYIGTMLAPDSPISVATSELSDIHKVGEIISKAQADPQSYKIIMPVKAGTKVVAAGRLTRQLTHLEVRSRAMLYEQGMREDLLNTVNATKDGYGFVIQDIRDALKYGNTPLKDRPASHIPMGGGTLPGVGTTTGHTSPAAVVAYLDKLRDIESTKGTMGFLKEVREAIRNPTAKAYSPAVMAEAQQYIDRALHPSVAARSSIETTVASLEQQIKVLEDASRSTHFESFDRLLGGGGEATRDVLGARIEGSVLDLMRSATTEGGDVTVRELLQEQIDHLRQTVKDLSRTRTPTQFEIAERLLESERSAKALRLTDLHKSRQALTATLVDYVTRLHDMRNNVIDSLKAGTAGKVDLMKAFRNGRISPEFIDNHAAQELNRIERGFSVFDELSPEAMERLKKGQLQGTIHLVDRESWDEGIRLLDDVRKPDPYRKFEMVRLMDWMSGWWKPMQTVALPYLNSRLRDVTQGVMTLSSQGLVTPGGITDALSLRNGIRRSMKENISLEEAFAGKSVKVKNAAGLWEDVPLYVLADQLQAANMGVGFGSLRSDLVASRDDILKTMGTTGKTIGQKVINSLNLFNVQKSPLGRAGIRIAEEGDQIVRMIGVTSALRKGYDIPTALKQVRKWTYGAGGPSTSFERQVMGRAIPFYNFASWAIKRTTEEILTNPGGIAQYERKLADVAWKNPILKEEGAPELDPRTEETLVPQFLKENFGIPWLSTPEGPHIAMLGSLIPEQQISGLVNALSRSVSGEQGTGIVDYLIQQSHPFFKGMFETMTGKDTFTGREFEAYPDELTEFMGVPMARSTERLIRQVRWLNDLDRLNVVNLSALKFGIDSVVRGTKPGEKQQTSFTERLLTGYLTPTKSYGVAMAEQARRVEYEQRQKLQNDVALLRRRMDENKPQTKENIETLRRVIASDLAAIEREKESVGKFVIPDAWRVSRRPLKVSHYFGGGGD